MARTGVKQGQGLVGTDPKSTHPVGDAAGTSCGWRGAGLGRRPHTSRSWGPQRRPGAASAADPTSAALPRGKSMASISINHVGGKLIRILNEVSAAVCSLGRTPSSSLDPQQAAAEPAACPGLARRDQQPGSLRARLWAAPGTGPALQLQLRCEHLPVLAAVKRR